MLPKYIYRPGVGMVENPQVATFSGPPNMFSDFGLDQMTPEEREQFFKYLDEAFSSDNSSDAVAATKSRPTEP